MKTTDLLENLRGWQKRFLKEQHPAALSVGAAIGKIEELETGWQLDSARLSLEIRDLHPKNTK